MGSAAILNALFFGLVEDADIPLTGALGALVALTTSEVEHLTKSFHDPYLGVRLPIILNLCFLFP